MDGKLSKIVVESRPTYALVYLQGCKQKFPVAWEIIFEIATARHEENLRLETEAEKCRDLNEHVDLDIAASA